MKLIWINQKAIITEGVLKGKEGLVVGFDSEEDIVTIKLDEITFIQISSDYVKQEITLKEVNKWNDNRNIDSFNVFYYTLFIY